MYQRGKTRGLLCSYCIQWSSEKKLSEILAHDYFTGEDATEHIDSIIQLLQETVSFGVPLLIKPIIEMRNSNSAMVACLQSGAYRLLTRKMIEIGVPRELAIRIHDSFLEELPEGTKLTKYQIEQGLREKLQEVIPQLKYWEQVQLDFLKKH